MLKQRILTALVIAPVALAGVFWLGEMGFAVFVGAIMVVSAWEWARLAGIEGRARFGYAGLLGLLLAGSHALAAQSIVGVSGSTTILALGLVWWAVAFLLVVRYPGLTRVWSAPLSCTIIGVLILVPGWIAMLRLKADADSTFLILLLFFLVWGADVGAYFAGRAFGKRKLAPDVSPGKSWAGFYGGLVTALLVALVASFAAGEPELLSLPGVLFLAACLCVAMVSVLGDLTISMFKRNAGVKDASNLLPGHGGFLDRIDSLLAAGPVFVVLMSTVGRAQVP